MHLEQMAKRVAQAPTTVGVVSREPQFASAQVQTAHQHAPWVARAVP